MTKSKSKPQPHPKIYKNECKACERCIIGCKRNALEISDDLNDIGYHYVKYKGENCNGCGDCYYSCPEPLAIEIHIPIKKRNNQEKANKIKKTNNPNQTNKINKNNISHKEEENDKTNKTGGK